MGMLSSFFVPQMNGIEVKLCLGGVGVKKGGNNRAKRGEPPKVKGAFGAHPY